MRECSILTALERAVRDAMTDSCWLLVAALFCGVMEGVEEYNARSSSSGDSNNESTPFTSFLAPSPGVLTSPTGACDAWPFATIFVAPALIAVAFPPPLATKSILIISASPVSTE